MSRRNNNQTNAAVASSQRKTIISQQAASSGPIKDFILIWLDPNIDVHNNDDSADTMSKLREIINDVKSFNDINSCLDFIHCIHGEKLFMITSGSYGQEVVPIVQDIHEVYAIFIFCGNKSYHEQWAKQFTKVKGVFKAIKPMCEAISSAVNDYDHNKTLGNCVEVNNDAAKANLDRLSSTFMYSQVLKEILLTINFKQEHFKKFITYCRQKLASDPAQLKLVDKFELEYDKYTPLQWYTFDFFLHKILNRALVTMDLGGIIKSGFFIRDLHNQIDRLHLEQYGGKQSSTPFVVFCGESLSQADFMELKKKTGSLYWFNQFLSTFKDRSTALHFVSKPSIETGNQLGILFVMTIDPTISSTPFAEMQSLSQFQQEQEVLFSMSSVFRIQTIKQIDGNDRLWQVDMTLTSDCDPQLQALTERLREETCPQKSGWYRLGLLSIKAEQFDVAEEIFNTLLDETTDGQEKADIYNQLGMIKLNQEKYSAAISFYEKCLRMNEKFLPPNHPDLANCYKNIGAACQKMGDYSTALSHYNKVLDIYQKTLPPNHPSLATSYHSVGLVLENMKDYQKALSFYEKAFEIHQRTLPSNHPQLQSYKKQVESLKKKL